MTMLEHATSLPGKATSAAADEHAVGKRTQVEAALSRDAEAHERSDFLWEDIPGDEVFQADAQRAAIGPEAAAYEESQGSHARDRHHDDEDHPTEGLHAAEHGGSSADLPADHAVGEGHRDASTEAAQDIEHGAHEHETAASSYDDPPSLMTVDAAETHAPAAIARARQLDPDAGAQSASAAHDAAPAPAHLAAHSVSTNGLFPAPASALHHAQPKNTKGQRLKIADPFILVDGPIWYAYGTTLSVSSSTDQGATWKSRGKMMSFGKGGRRWAPEVHKIGDKYVAYMSIGSGQTGRLRIYVASSDHPVHGWSQPRAIVSSNKWNDIDPTFYHDEKSDKNYLLYKEDGKTRQGHRKRIAMVQLDSTGKHLSKHNRRKHTLLVAGVGKYSELERRPKPRNANWSVEAPTLEKHGDRYWLFYSGAGYEVGGGYFVGVASSAKITGPFHREAHPLLRGSSGTMHEPGHQSIIRIVVDGVVRWLMFFHARDATGKTRYLREDQIVWVNGKPHVKQL